MFLEEVPLLDSGSPSALASSLGRSFWRFGTTGFRRLSIRSGCGWLWRADPLFESGAILLYLIKRHLKERQSEPLR